MALRLTHALALVALLASTACTTRSVVTASELQGGNVYGGTWLRDELYLGLRQPDGSIVTDSAFNAFVTREIVTRLPGGFTIMSALGYWRMETGQTINEPSRVLILYYRDTEREKARALADIIVIYKRVFKQESVLRVTLPVRIAF